ncbi:MAG: hypothetical protein F7C38_07830 [Desulfurococcales archaeon]|nr:hypothetical protein [Desulfurococcales archaeon]
MASRNATLALLLVVIILGGVLVYLGLHGGANKHRTTSEGSGNALANITLGEATNYTLNVASGSVIVYNLSYLTSEGKAAQVTLYTLNITSVSWPLIDGNYTVSSENKTMPARVPIGNLAMPKEMLGKSKVSLPLILPSGVNTALCVDLELKNTTSIEVMGGTRQAYIYSMHVEKGDYTINGTLAYDAENGLLLSANFTVLGGGKILYYSHQLTLNYTLTGWETVTTPRDWFCTQPYSSDLRFTLEATYELKNGSLTMVPADLVREASLDNGLIAVLIKEERPVNMIFWENLLKASKLCPGKATYVIVGGGLSSDTERALIENIMEKANAQTTGLLVKFKQGYVEEAVFPYDPAGKLANLVCGLSP